MRRTTDYGRSNGPKCRRESGVRLAKEMSRKVMAWAAPRSSLARAPAGRTCRCCSGSTCPPARTCYPGCSARCPPGCAGPSASEKGVRLARKMEVGPRIPAGIQLFKAEVGPTSGPTWRLSHLHRRRPVVEHRPDVVDDELAHVALHAGRG
jgi:hypothetical protein